MEVIDILALKDALNSIISDWNFQKEMCDSSFPTSHEYELFYQKMSVLHEALVHLQGAGLVQYKNGEWYII
ncbi:hypothetical protein SOV_20090 [Sporomusa ovata DSM 2662]|uniref:Uncharacterized protein n=1 Tax=Sporomusa ovata TaxID=2378 RepID=A0A0U1KXI6_9FIRM|nr:hypothetical protein SOV_1c13410 [Sporomusa ovata DSM 2662]CQR72120.1 hypothetical protein SpAn4DRAFT_4809 [Sporomusa ovata]